MMYSTVLEWMNCKWHYVHGWVHRLIASFDNLTNLSINVLGNEKEQCLDHSVLAYSMLRILFGGFSNQSAAGALITFHLKGQVASISSKSATTFFSD